MTSLIVLLCIVLLLIVILQISRINDLAKRIRGDEESELISNNQTAVWLLVFVIVFLIGTVWSAYHYKNYMLGYGPHVSASEHGGKLDTIFDITLVATGIVFFITQFLLFYFAFKYRQKKGRKALYMPHDNKLEVIWTIVPAVVMAALVIGGLDAWNTVMKDVDEKDNYMEIEAMGMQFAWVIRYPGADGALGTRNFRKITGANPMGLDWTDAKTLDDFQPNEIVLPVGKKVRVRITSRDVLHSFFIPHMRVKMDAVPGMPTYFVFTPKITTAEYRNNLSKYAEYNTLADPKDPDSKKRWEIFEYELACAELCGNSHFSMRVPVKIVTEQEYQTWLKTQTSYYVQNIQGKDEDPYVKPGVQAPAEMPANTTTQDTAKNAPTGIKKDSLPPATVH